MTLLRLASRPRTWSVSLAAVALLGAAWIVLSAVPAESGRGLPPNPSEGFPAPDFSLLTADGTPLRLTSFRGSVVVLNLWTSWCPPCRAEMPALQGLHERFGESGLAVLGVNAAIQDTRADALGFLGDLGITFPVVFDELGEVSPLYFLRALPSTFIIDGEGTVREVIIGGPISASALQSSVERLLLERP